MFTGLKSFGSTFKTHWVWGLVLLLVVAVFVARPLVALAMRVPVLNQLPGIKPTAAA